MREKNKAQNSFLRTYTNNYSIDISLRNNQDGEKTHHPQASSTRHSINIQHCWRTLFSMPYLDYLSFHHQFLLCNHGIFSWCWWKVPKCSLTSTLSHKVMPNSLSQLLLHRVTIWTLLCLTNLSITSVTTTVKKKHLQNACNRNS